MIRGRDALAAVSEETGYSVAQVAINWVADQPGIIAIPKSNSTQRTEDNCAASGWHLTTEQRHALERAFPV